MKTKIVKTESADKSEYPCLMTYAPSKNFVVLFTDLSRGVVVHSENDDWCAGVYRDDWADCSFSLCEDSVVLSN